MSAAASESILFIGAVVAAAGLVGALTAVTAELSTGLRERASTLGDEMAGRIAIVNDPLNTDPSPLTLYVKNTGTRDQVLARFAILVDGQASSSWTATVGGAPAEAIRPGELATITVADVAPAAGDHRVTVVSGTGFAAHLDFRV